MKSFGFIVAAVLLTLVVLGGLKMRDCIPIAMPHSENIVWAPPASDSIVDQMKHAVSKRLLLLRLEFADWQINDRLVFSEAVAEVEMPTARGWQTRKITFVSVPFTKKWTRVH